MSSVIIWPRQEWTKGTLRHYSAVIVGERKLLEFPELNLKTYSTLALPKLSYNYIVHMAHVDVEGFHAQQALSKSSMVCTTNYW